VLGVLAAIALILRIRPGEPRPAYAPIQLIFVGASSLVLYAVFVFVQTVRHLDYFLLPAGTDHPEHRVPSNMATGRSAVLLMLALVCVVLLAKTLSPASIVRSPAPGCR